MTQVVRVATQPFGQELFAPMAASSLGHVLTYIPSLFFALRANIFLRGPLES
jgi:hypothetical protein